MCLKIKFFYHYFLVFCNRKQIVNFAKMNKSRHKRTPSQSPEKRKNKRLATYSSSESDNEDLRSQESAQQKIVEETTEVIAVNVDFSTNIPT